MTKQNVRRIITLVERARLESLAAGSSYVMTDGEHIRSFRTYSRYIAFEKANPNYCLVATFHYGCRMEEE